MSDLNKAEKLAAARKKLKEFQNQQKNKDNNVHANEQIPQQSVKNAEFISYNDSRIWKPANQVAEIPVETVGIPMIDTSSGLYQPSLSNYFQQSDRNGFFFDTVEKPMNGEANRGPYEYLPQGLSAHSSAPASSAPSVLALDDTRKDDGEDLEKKQNEVAENSKQDLQIAEAKIKMQTEALDIITGEREDLQKKLKSRSNEVNVYEERIQSLQNQLDKSLSNQKELNVTITELKRFKDDVCTRELALEQNMNDLKEKNDELLQSLEVYKEKNTRLQNQLEETHSNYNMLTLKFQQLGIEVGNDGKNYHSVSDECESWKSKCGQLEERLKTMIFEKEHTNDEYRQYVDNLKEELQNSNSELQRMCSENLVLAGRVSSQTEHISNLEKQLQIPPREDNNDEVVSQLRAQIDLMKREIEDFKNAHEQLLRQLAEYEQAIQHNLELERELENIKTEMMNAGEWQSIVESNKVAASQAISQNNKLKTELEQLHQMVEILNGEKSMLTQMLQEEKTKNKKLDDMQQELRKNSSQEIQTNDAAINTDVGDANESNASGKGNFEAMLQLQDKFKSVLDRMADLTDEKQQLEHLVLQLQCETETIEEYVALYQKQRSVLQQRARETDLQMERVSQEKERLLNILRSILATDQFDCNFVKKLVEDSLSINLGEELAHNNSNVNSNAIFGVQSPVVRNDVSHHPSCPCCSGQLITI